MKRQLQALLLAASLGMGAYSSLAVAYDNDEQALRIRDTISQPSVPLAWDRRQHPETWRSYRYEGPRDRCGRHAYWDGDECVRVKRR